MQGKAKKTSKKTTKKTTKAVGFSFGMAMDLDDEQFNNAPPPSSAAYDDGQDFIVFKGKVDKQAPKQQVSEIKLQKKESVSNKLSGIQSSQLHTKSQIIQGSHTSSQVRASSDTLHKNNNQRQKNEQNNQSVQNEQNSQSQTIEQQQRPTTLLSHQLQSQTLQSRNQNIKDSVRDKVISQQPKQQQKQQLVIHQKQEDIDLQAQLGQQQLVFKNKKVQTKKKAKSSKNQTKTKQIKMKQIDTEDKQQSNQIKIQQQPAISQQAKIARHEEVKQLDRKQRQQRQQQKVQQNRIDEQPKHNQQHVNQEQNQQAIVNQNNNVESNIQYHNQQQYQHLHNQYGHQHQQQQQHQQLQVHTQQIQQQNRQQQHYKNDQVQVTKYDNNQQQQVKQQKNKIQEYSHQDYNQQPKPIQNVNVVIGQQITQPQEQIKTIVQQQIKVQAQQNIKVEQVNQQNINKVETHDKSIIPTQQNKSSIKDHQQMQQQRQQNMSRIKQQTVSEPKIMKQKKTKVDNKDKGNKKRAKTTTIGLNLNQFDIQQDQVPHTDPQKQTQSQQQTHLVQQEQTKNISEQNNENIETSKTTQNLINNEPVSGQQDIQKPNQITFLHVNNLPENNLKLNQEQTISIQKSAQKQHTPTPSVQITTQQLDLQKQLQQDKPFEKAKPKKNVIKNKNTTKKVTKAAPKKLFDSGQQDGLEFMLETVQQTKNISEIVPVKQQQQLKVQQKLENVQKIIQNSTVPQEKNDKTQELLHKQDVITIPDPVEKQSKIIKQINDSQSASVNSGPSVKVQTLDQDADIILEDQHKFTTTKILNPTKKKATKGSKNKQKDSKIENNNKNKSLMNGTDFFDEMIEENVIQVTKVQAPILQNKVTEPQKVTHEQPPVVSKQKEQTNIIPQVIPKIENQSPVSIVKQQQKTEIITEKPVQFQKQRSILDTPKVTNQLTDIGKEQQKQSIKFTKSVVMKKKNNNKVINKTKQTVLSNLINEDFQAEQAKLQIAEVKNQAIVEPKQQITQNKKVQKLPQHKDAEISNANKHQKLMTEFQQTKDNFHDVDRTLDFTQKQNQKKKVETFHEFPEKKVQKQPVLAKPFINQLAELNSTETFSMKASKVSKGKAKASKKNVQSKMLGLEFQKEEKITQQDLLAPEQAVITTPIEIKNNQASAVSKNTPNSQSQSPTVLEIKIDNNEATKLTAIQQSTDKNETQQQFHQSKSETKQKQVRAQPVRKSLVDELVSIATIANRKHLNAMKERLLMMQEDIRSSLMQRQERQRAKIVPEVHYDHIVEENVELKRYLSQQARTQI